MLSFRDLPGVSDCDGPMQWIKFANERNRLEYDGPERLSARVQARRGELQGDYRDPVSGARVRFDGVVFQKQGLAAGHFVEEGLSGAARIAPAA